jgi:hypothetical protein
MPYIYDAELFDLRELKTTTALTLFLFLKWVFARTLRH